MAWWRLWEIVGDYGVVVYSSTFGPHSDRGEMGFAEPLNEAHLQDPM